MAKLKRGPVRVGTIAVWVLALQPTPGPATTLSDAIAAVRAGSPEIAAQQAQVASNTAQIAIVRAPARPQIQATGSFTQGTRGANVSSGFDRTIDDTLFASLSVYDGGSVKNGVAAQRLRLNGSEADAEATEMRVVTDAITAYVDVVRYREIVVLNDENIRLLDRDLAANRERFRVGDVTRTDLSQTEARHALAIARLADAQTDLAASEESYRRLVGAEPVALAPPPPLPVLLVDPGDLEDRALARDPRLAAARAEADAARADIRVARSAARPTLTLTGGGEYHDYTQSPIGYPNQRGGGAEASGALAYPVYQGGLVRAQIALARASAAKAGFDRVTMSRTVAADARTSLARYAASLGTMSQTELAAASEREAVRGMQIEAKGGERSVLDVLNADRELLDVEVALVNARRDSYIAGVDVLAAMNRLGCLEASGPSSDCLK